MSPENRNILIVVVALVLISCGCCALSGGVYYLWSRNQQTALVPTKAIVTTVPTPAPASTEKAPVPAPTAVPTAAVATTGPLGMKYQFDAGCAATSSPMDYPACILQRVQAGELSAEQAVVLIQALGAKFAAPSFEGSVLSLPNAQPAIVWCPSGGIFPPDTARPLEGTKGAQWASNLVVIDAGTGGPDRIIKATGTNPCWMVYRR